MKLAVLYTYTHAFILQFSLHSSLAGKLGDLQSAVQSFQRSLELATLLEDEASQAAIRRALEDVNSRIVEELKQPTGEDPDS